MIKCCMDQASVLKHSQTNRANVFLDKDRLTGLSVEWLSRVVEYVFPTGQHPVIIISTSIV